METNGEQNNDLQTQNLGDNEESHHLDNKEEETKPENVGNVSQNSIQNLTQVDQESNTNTNIQIDECTTNNKTSDSNNDDTEVSKTSVEQTDNQKESDKYLLDNVQDEIKQQTENVVSLIDELGKNDDNNNNDNENNSNSNEIKTRGINFNDDSNNDNNDNEEKDKANDSNDHNEEKNEGGGNINSENKRNNNVSKGKNIKNQGLRNSSRSQSKGRNRKYTGDDEVKTREIKEQDELDEIETERRKVIAGDISINGSEDEGEEIEGKKEKHFLKISPSTNGGKNKKSNKYVKLSKKNLKNYRSFVSVKPSCNRYMANMWDNYVYSIHKMNISNIKKTIDNDAPKKYAHVDQKLKAKQMKKDKEEEIRKNNRNILDRMIYQGRNNVGTTNLDDNNDVIEPVFRSLHAEQNKRLEEEMNRESLTLLKRLKERKPTCSVEQWEKDRLITEVYLRNISVYPENYPVRQKSKQKHVPPIKKNENEEIKREKSPLEAAESIYSAGTLKANRLKTAGASGLKKKKQDDLIVNTKNDNETVKPRKPKQRTLSESTRQSFKLYGDNSINQNQADCLEQKKNGKLNKITENNETTFEKAKSEIKDDDGNKNINNNDLIKDSISDNNQVSEDETTKLNETQNNPPVEEIPITE